ncbi:MAG: inositol monophosphatase, partial [Sinobacteraceae bacterium]|nr:inositol monophosphatase [Nevskiaceae bacterium]
SGGEYLQGGNILCGTPKVYEALLEVLAPHLPETLREG